MIDYYASYVNLPHRQDRRDHMEYQLKKAGIEATLTRGMYPNEYQGDEAKVGVQRRRTPGSIGCMLSQMKVMLDAFKLGKNALIFEDDCYLCSDFQVRLEYISTFLENCPNWDVFWLGGTVHIPDPVWRTGNNPDLPGADYHLDAEPTAYHRIIKCYSAFCTYAYIVNYNSIEKVLRMLDEVMHLSMGIDWSFIKLGLELNTYMFLPGCVRQIDNQSDIGNGMTYFSGFEKLGPHWYQDKAEDFDPSTINWNK